MSTDRASSTGARWPRTIVGCLVALCMSAPSYAADFDTAVRAAREGDYETAHREFTALAASGDPRGENGLGVLHARGLGLEPDLERAVTLFRSAAQRGLRTAQKNLGEMYADGSGVPRNDAAAVHWFGLAAAQNDVDAQLRLGLMYAQGKGVAQDYRQAMAWFRKSAEQGDAEAQANIGHLYRAGYGIKRDYVLAYAWYGVAAAQGFKMGPELRESIALYLTPSQLVQARKTARSIWQNLAAPTAADGAAATTP